MKISLHRILLFAAAGALLLLTLSCRREPAPETPAPEEPRARPVVLNNQGQTPPQRVDPQVQRVSKRLGQEIEWQAAGTADLYVVFFKRDVDGKYQPDPGPFGANRFEVQKGQRTKSGPVRPDAPPGEYEYGVEIYIGGKLVETIDPRVIVEN
jgi:hypothetical protein